jgi:hypothetical protein
MRIGEGRCIVIDLDALRSVVEMDMERTLRFRCLRADGKEMKIAADFAVGRSGGISYVMALLGVKL